MMRENPSASRTRAVVQRYGLAVLSVATALGVGCVMYYYFQVKNGQIAILLMAVAVTVWFGGKWPGILAVVLSILGFDYFFLPPLFHLYFTRADIPYDVVLILFAWLITWFSSVRHRIEVNLRLSRDELQREVAIRTQQASLLNLTHDSILVRDMSGVITY
jgi:K+-sensing histidine kinase KdpD